MHVSCTCSTFQESKHRTTTSFHMPVLCAAASGSKPMQHGFCQDHVRLCLCVNSGLAARSLMLLMLLLHLE
jgi:hypothetical protein